MKLFKLVTAALFALIFLNHGSFAMAQDTVGHSATSFTPYSTVGNLSGCLQAGPCGSSQPLVGTGANGEVTLVWPSVMGKVTSIKGATIKPDGAHTGPVVTLSGSLSAIAPALAVASSGRVAVAWFHLKHVSAGRESRLGVAALQVRERLPGGEFGAIRTIWESSRPQTYPHEVASTDPDGEGDVQIALDQNGDEVIAWETSKLMVVTRRADGAFTKPYVLGSYEGKPAVAMSPTGEATIIWSGDHTNRLLTSTWEAGSDPRIPVVLQENLKAEFAGGVTGGFTHISLAVDNNTGEELGSWLEESGNESLLTSVGVIYVAWRSSGQGFAAPQAIHAPGLSSEEPTIALSRNGQALLAWAEVTSVYDIPMGHAPPSVLHHTHIEYSQTSVGGSFTVVATVPPPFSSDGIDPAVSWLEDGTALIAEKQARQILVAHLDSEALSPFSTLGMRPYGDDEGAPVIAAGGSSDPVVAWSSEEREWPIRYAIGDGIGGVHHLPVASVLEERRGHPHIYDKRGVMIAVRCDEPCRLTATARLFVEAETQNASWIKHDIGRLPVLQKIIQADRLEYLKIPMSLKLRRVLCGKRWFEIEIVLSAEGLVSGLTRHVTEGANPGDMEVAYGCPGE